MKRLEMQNLNGVRLIIELGADRPYTPRIVLESSRIVLESSTNKTSGINFFMNSEQEEELKKFFADDNYIFMPALAKWLETHEKELVTKEDLKSLLEIAKYQIIQMQNQIDAISKAANRITRIASIYQHLQEGEK